MANPILSKRGGPPVGGDPSERRQSSRIGFSATGQVVEPVSKAVIALRVGDLSPGGCYADSLAVFPVGTVVRLSVRHAGRDFGASAKVVSAQSGMGMGLKFLDLPPDMRSLLQEWVGPASEEFPEDSRVASPAESLSMPQQTTVSAQTSSAPLKQKFTLARLIQLMMDKGQLTQAEGHELLKELLGL